MISAIPQEVLANLRESIKKESGITVLPIRAERWEEIVVDSFRRAGFHPGWDPGSHQAGADIAFDNRDLFVTQPKLNMAVSCKSGIIFGARTKRLKFSSFRTTQHKTLQEKIEYFDGEGKNFTHYLIISREEDDRFRNYTVWSINANHIRAANFVWREEKGGWKTEERYGFKMHIVKCMSDQFWVFMDLRYLKNHAKHRPDEVDVLFEVTIPKKDLGKTHEIVPATALGPHDFIIEEAEFDSKINRWLTLISSERKIDNP